MQIHHAKIHPQFFSAVKSGEKPFEIRYDDRGYQKGDQLVLEEWDPDRNDYTGGSLTRYITYVTSFRQTPGYVVLGISEVSP